MSTPSTPDDNERTQVGTSGRAGGSPREADGQAGAEAGAAANGAAQRSGEAGPGDGGAARSSGGTGGPPPPWQRGGAGGSKPAGRSPESGQGAPRSGPTPAQGANRGGAASPQPGPAPAGPPQGPGSQGPGSQGAGPQGAPPPRPGAGQPGPAQPGGGQPQAGQPNRGAPGAGAAGAAGAGAATGAAAGRSRGGSSGIDAPTNQLSPEQLGMTSRGGGTEQRADDDEVADIGRSKRRAPLRASLQLKRFDPWSVLKLAFVLGVALFLVWMFAVGVLYAVLDGMGVWAQLNGTYQDLTADASSGGQLITAGGVFGVAAIVGVINTILFMALASVSAFIYNISADVAGGIEVTLSERD